VDWQNNFLPIFFFILILVELINNSIMKNFFFILLCMIFLSFQMQGQNNFYQNNRTPLTQNAFIELPLGSIHAEGWLKEKLNRQQKGLTGHLDELYPLVMGQTNGWLGGDGDQWERGPYWIDGLLPLAYILNDNELKLKVQKWVDWTINSQREDGYFGPQKDYQNNIPGVQRDNCDDWWPKMVMLKVLQQYYSATNDKRVISFMTNYFHYQLKQLPINHLDFRSFWARYRGGDNLMVVLWLYNITGEIELLKLADIIYNQTFDFVSTFKTKNWWSTGSMHCVNLTQGLKSPAIYSQFKNKEENLFVLKNGFNDIKTFLGFPHGGFGGDEALHGNNPTQGSELCTIVEYMFSLEKIFQISGDIDYAEQIERLAFNALPAQSDDQYMNRQYFQQTNQVCVTKHDRNFDTYHKGTPLVFGLLSGYPCCTANMHQGIPKFVQNLWYATSDNGLAAVLFSPSTMKAKVGDGTEVSIIETTDYPFSEKISLTINPKKEVSFPLYLRVPTWCKKPSILLNSKYIKLDVKNGLVSIHRSWNQGDEVQIEYPMEVTISNWYERSATVERGPLVYALKMDEKWTLKPYVGEDIKWYGKNYWEITSDSPWNFALIDCPKEEINSHYKVLLTKKIPLFPWNVTSAPIQIKTFAKRVPNWQLYNESCGPIPYSIAHGMPFGEQDSITLIPYGCTKLRIAEFPVKGKYTIK
jgi:hypothetical protein